MSNMDKIVSRVLRFDIFRNHITEKLHNLMHEDSTSIEDTKNVVCGIILSDTKDGAMLPLMAPEGRSGPLSMYNGLADILSAKKVERFPIFCNDNSLEYYKKNFNNLITAALFHQDNITIPFCFERNCSHPVYMNYIKKYHLEKIQAHINKTEDKESKVMFIPFFINGKLTEFIKLTGKPNMPTQVKIAEGTKGIFQIADMAIVDRHRDAFPSIHRLNYDEKNKKLLNAEKKMHLLVNSHPEKLNINIVANNELKGLLKLIVKENETFIKMFSREAIRGTSSTIIESFYEQELSNIKKKDLHPATVKKVSTMYQFVLAVSALEIGMTMIDSNDFLRIYRANKDIDLKQAYLSLLKEHMKQKLDRLGIDMKVFDEKHLNILFEKKIKARTTKAYIGEVRKYHNAVIKRLYETNDRLAQNFETYINNKNLDLFPILDLDNLLGHGPIDGDDMLRKFILGGPERLHILLFELVPDAPHFWKKIYHCFNHLSDAANTLIAFNETIFDVVVNNYLPSEKKGFHFDDSDEVIIIINDDEQLQMLHIEEYIKFLRNCYEDNKKVLYVSDGKGLEGTLNYGNQKIEKNARFDKVNQYILDKVQVSTDKKPIVLNFSETKLKHVGDKLHELLCTVGDYQGKSILFGYSAPSSFALMKIYNKHAERKNTY